jgi:hypothetical protein
MKVGTNLLGTNGGGGAVDYNQMGQIIGAAVAEAMTKVPINVSVRINEREIASGVNAENNKSTSKLP